MQQPTPCVGSGPQAWQSIALSVRAGRWSVSAPAPRAPRSAASTRTATSEPGRGEPDRATTKVTSRPRVRRAPLLDVLDRLARGAARAEQLADPALAERLDVLRRGDGAAGGGRGGGG